MRATIPANVRGFNIWLIEGKIVADPSAKYPPDSLDVEAAAAIAMVKRIDG